VRTPATAGKDIFYTLAGLSAMLPTISNLLVAGENTCHGVNYNNGLYIYTIIADGKPIFQSKFVVNKQ
jgi:hypothetical protein